MTKYTSILCIVIAFFFLSVFVGIRYIPADWVLYLYSILTSDNAIKITLALLPAFIIFSIFDNDYGHSLALIIFMSGQTMFVYVYADQYEISISSQDRKPIKTKYNPYFEQRA